MLYERENSYSPIVIRENSATPNRDASRYPAVEYRNQRELHTCVPNSLASTIQLSSDRCLMTATAQAILVVFSQTPVRSMRLTVMSLQAARLALVRAVLALMPSRATSPRDEHGSQLMKSPPPHILLSELNYR